MTKTYTITTDDETVARRAMAAPDLCAVLWELKEEIRRDWKYHDNVHRGNHWQIMLSELLEQHGVDLERLWQ